MIVLPFWTPQILWKVLHLIPISFIGMLTFNAERAAYETVKINLLLQKHG